MCVLSNLAVGLPLNQGLLVQSQALPALEALLRLPTTTADGQGQAGSGGRGRGRGQGRDSQGSSEWSSDEGSDSDYSADTRGSRGRGLGLVARLGAVEATVVDMALGLVLALAKREGGAEAGGTDEVGVDLVFGMNRGR